MRTAHTIEKACRDLIPSAYWTEVMTALARSIDVAHHSDSNRWGVRFDERGIMLKVDPHEVFQIGPWELPVHLVVDRATVPAALRTLPGVHFSEDADCYGKRGAIGYYASNPGTEACDLEYASLQQVYSDLFHSHSLAINRAAKKQRHGSTRKTHCPDLVALIGIEARQTLAQPDYWIPDTALQRSTKHGV